MTPRSTIWCSKQLSYASIFANLSCRCLMFYYTKTPDHSQRGFRIAVSSARRSAWRPSQILLFGHWIHLPLLTPTIESTSEMCSPRRGQTFLVWWALEITSSSIQNWDCRFLVWPAQIRTPTRTSAKRTLMFLIWELLHQCHEIIR